VERIDDVVEADPRSRRDQFGLRKFTAIECPARLQESARPRCRLLVDTGQVFADIPGKRRGELIERHAIVLAVSHAEQRLRKGELVRGDVAPEHRTTARQLASSVGALARKSVSQ